MSIGISASVGKGGVNLSEDVLTVKARLIELGFDWLQNNDVIDDDTIHVIRLFQAIKNGDQTVDRPHNDGLVDVNGSTHRWLSASNAPRWHLMEAGSPVLGYVNAEVADPNDHHDYGTRWLSLVIEEAGASYRDDHLADHPNDAVITINDASLPHGTNTDDHAGHETGLSCDLKLPRTDGQAGGITWESDNYDQSAARAMLEAFSAQPLFVRAFFNDPDLIAAQLCKSMTGHDNHIHIEVGPPELAN